MRYHHLSVDPPPRTPPGGGAIVPWAGPSDKGRGSRPDPDLSGNPRPPLDKENGVCYIAHIAMKRTSSGAAAAQRTPGR